MDKIKINNQIVLMRKFVKQSKVHNINRLTKQVKLFQDRKGNEAQMQKAKRKADRFLEEINILKKVNPDDVSKLALSKAKDWNLLLLQKNIPLDERCTAMLANCESVQKEVEEFYNKNPYLVSRISMLLKEWNNNSKNNYKKSSQILKTSELKFKNDKKNWVQTPRVENIILQSNNVSKKNNDLENKDTNPLSIEKENCEMNKNKMSNTEINTSISNVTSEVETQDESIEHSSSNEGETKDESESSSENDNESDKNDDESETSQKSSLKFEKGLVRSKVNSEAETNKEKISVNHMYITNLENEFCKIKNSVDIQSKSKNNLKAVAILNLEELQGFDEIPINKTLNLEENSECEISITKSSEPENSDNKTKIIKSDPFFLGSQEASFESENDSDKIDKKPLWRKEFLSEKPNFSKRHERENYSKRQNYSPSYSRKSYGFRNEDIHFKNHKRDSYHNIDEQKFKIMNKRGNKSDMFRNNKHNFNEAQSKNAANKRSFFDAKQKSTNKKSKMTDELPLHPSWQAKRKLKGFVNTSVKGKRIVFDD